MRSDPCPRNRKALIKWEIYGATRTRAHKKHIKINIDTSKEGLGKVDCDAMSEKGICLIDWGPCPIEEILSALVKKYAGWKQRSSVI